MREILLTKGLVATVDNEDYDWLNRFNWYAKKQRSDSHYYYAALSVRKNSSVDTVFMHRVIMRCPIGKVVHHKNANGLDNRKSNLEIMDERRNHGLVRGPYQKRSK